MPPLKSQGRANVAKQKSKPKRKGNEQKNMRQKASKPPQTPEEKLNAKGNSATVRHVKENMRNGIDQRRNKRSEEKHNKAGRTENRNRKSQPDCEERHKITYDINQKKKLPSKTGGGNPPIKPENHSESQENQSETETGGEEEEQGSDKERKESEDRSEDGQVQDTQSEDAQVQDTQSEESDREEAQSSRSGSEEEPLQSTEEEEQGKKDATISDDSDEDMTDQGISQEYIQQLPADEAHRQCKQLIHPCQPSKEPKHKMFKKSKAEKQAEKTEKKRLKAEQLRLETEAKQKAKEEKKKKKKLQKNDKPRPETEEDLPHNDDPSMGRKPRLSKLDIITDGDDPGEAESDHKEELEAVPDISKTMECQSQMKLLKPKGEGLENSEESAEQQDAEAAVKRKPRGFLLGKAKMASLGQKADKMMTRIKEDTLESEVTEEVSSKSKEHLIGRRRSMSALGRVSGWIQRKMPQKFNFRKKLSALTKAIGISRWLSVRAIKRKQGTKKSKGNIFKHRMAVTIASKTNPPSKNKSSAEDRLDQDKATLQGNAAEGEEETGPAVEKEVEAKYAVVLPRMNKLGKAKTREASKAAPGLSTPSGPPEEPPTLESKPPKPGAKLVLPVKPDLSLLKSMKNPLLGRLPSDGDVTDKRSGSCGTSEESFPPNDRTRTATPDDQNGVSMLQAARGKLKPSHINLSRRPGGAAGVGAARPNRPDTVGPDAIPIATSEPFADGETGEAMSGVRSPYEEEEDREVAQLMAGGGTYSFTQPDVHWAGNPQMRGDPQVGVLHSSLNISKEEVHLFEL